MLSQHKCQKMISHPGRIRSNYTLAEYARMVYHVPLETIVLSVSDMV